MEAFNFNVVPDKNTFLEPLTRSGGTPIGKFNCLIGLEAGFATAFPTGAPVDGQKSVFQRVRLLWVAVPQAGFYVLKHPYGVENIPITTADLQVKGGKGMCYTVDTPLAINNPHFNFSVALTGPITNFLQQLNPPPQNTTTVPPIPPPYNKPTDWFGDGVTPATFTGSALNPPFNAFRLEAWQDSAHTIPLNLWPDVVTATTNFVETNLAVISGNRLKLGKGITGALDLLLLN